MGEERAARKDRERKERDERYKHETEEERQLRKEKERKEKENRVKGETEEERRNKKEREKRDGRDRKHETDEERMIRKEKEKKDKEDKKKSETEEERLIRKERERREREERKNETDEERRIRKEKERKEKERKRESDGDRMARKEKERQERKDRERIEKIGIKKDIDEPMELGDDYFAQEEARLTIKREPKETSNVSVSSINDFGVEKTELNDEYIKEEESDEDLPLAQRKSLKNKKRKMESGEDSDEEPLSKKKAKAKKLQKKIEDDEFKKKKSIPEKKLTGSPTKKQTKKEKELEEEKKVWKWWEESEQLPEGVKWRFLQHKGPLFAPEYETLPDHVRFWYDGKVMKLKPDTEEAATFYGKMLDHDYTTKEVFNKNFFKDWRKIMTDNEKEIIRDLHKCDFSEINEHFKKLSEERKNRSKEEKKAEKEKNEKIIEEFGFCDIDGHKEKIGNFRTEPPSLFRGRGEHPKQGMIKRRIMPEDVIINCSKDSDVPVPPDGHKWKKVQHDNTVTWLASWTENIQGQIKYIMLNPSSKLKGEKDWQKYEKARKLNDKIEQIREDYLQDLRSKEMRVRQRAVALYFIDKLALRAGNEKDGDQADTVGCCSLRFEHIELHDELDGKEFVVEMDFLGKDSIRYQNAMAVEKKVF